MTLHVKLATGPYDRMRAFHTGDVRVEAIDVDYTAVIEPPDTLETRFS